MRVLIIIFVLVLSSLSCSNNKENPWNEKSKTASEFLSNGYKIWDELNILYKNYGDTTILVSLDTNNILKSKSIFIPINQNDQTISSFFEKKGFIEFLDCSDSLVKTFVFNPEMGNLYEVIVSDTKVELSQKNRIYVAKSKF
jgi:hypothetical protein